MTYYCCYFNNSDFSVDYLQIIKPPEQIFSITTKIKGVVLQMTACLFAFASNSRRTDITRPHTALIEGNSTFSCVADLLFEGPVLPT